jgi:hypothetical protein
MMFYSLSLSEPSASVAGKSSITLLGAPCQHNADMCSLPAHPSHRRVGHGLSVSDQILRLVLSHNASHVAGVAVCLSSCVAAGWLLTMASDGPLRWSASVAAMDVSAALAASRGATSRLRL